MKRELVSRKSAQLDMSMDTLVYGEKGYPVVVFPTQDSPCTNFEDFGMIDTLADYIDGGKVQLFCVSVVDTQTWSAVSADREARSAREEAYYRYVCEELLPLVHEMNGSELRPLAVGCSMGATHSAIFALRRPDLFQGCIALSGVYSSQLFYGNWMDDTLYQNDPCAFLPNMPEDHAYIPLYNARQLVFCVGQGAWEEDGIRTQRVLDEEFERLGVGAWCDYWGFDVNHDWPWWKKQIRYFLPIVLDEVEKSLEAEAAEAASSPLADIDASEKPAPKAKKSAARRKDPAKAPAAEGREPTKMPEPSKPEAKGAAKAEPKAAPAAAAAKKPAAKSKAKAKGTAAKDKAPAKTAAKKPAK